MKSVARLIPILAACSLSVAAYEPVPGGMTVPSTQGQSAGGAERILSEALYDLTDSLFAFSCSDDGEPLPLGEGELVRLEGQVYERISLLTDGAGGIHFNLNTMPVGLRGTGVISGEEFRVSENQRFIASQRLAGGTGSYRQELKMVGKDTHRTFWLVMGGNYVILANGEVIVSRDTERIECKR